MEDAVCEETVKRDTDIAGINKETAFSIFPIWKRKISQDGSARQSPLRLYRSLFFSYQKTSTIENLRTKKRIRMSQDIRIY